MPTGNHESNMDIIKVKRVEKKKNSDEREMGRGARASKSALAVMAPCHARKK
jgi:hypothetical protein